MKLRIEIDLDNAAFADGRVREVARILSEVTQRLPESGSTAFSVRDLNGNTVGTVEVAN